MRMLALGLAAAALVIPVSSANAGCRPVTEKINVCETHDCVDHLCLVRVPTSVSTECAHPIPTVCNQYVSLEKIATR